MRLKQFFLLPFYWLRSAAPYRRFWLGGPLLLYSWTLFFPFVGDDLHILLQAEQYIHNNSPEKSLELYRFAKSDESWQRLRDRGTLPWWMPETGRFDYFRPITEWSFFADVLLFGRHPLGYRLVSLLVFVAALLSVHWLFYTASQEHVRAGVATFLFGISQTVTPPATWLCNRQDLLVAIGVALAAGAYWSSWKRPKYWHFILAVAGYTFALLSKEMAISLAGIVVLHEVLKRWKPDARRLHPATAMIGLLLGATAVCYLSYYFYTRPWVLDFTGADGAPSQMSDHLPLVFPLYAAVWTIGFPVDVLFNATAAQVYSVAAAGVIMALIVAFYLRRSIRGDRAALFFVLWALLFMLPGLRAFTTSTRTLCVATIGWVYILAGMIVPEHEDQVVVPLFFRHWIWAANGFVSILCAIATVLVMNNFETLSRTRIVTALDSIKSPLREGDTLILQDSESAVELICAADRLEYLTGLKDVSLNFLMGPGIRASSVQAEDDHTLLFRSDGEDLLGSRLHKLILGPHWKPEVGHAFHVKGFTAEIAEVQGSGIVTALRFRFNKPLGSPELHFSPLTLDTIARSAASSVDLTHSAASKQLDAPSKQAMTQANDS